MYISPEDIDILSGVWWEIERIDAGIPTEATLEDVSDALLEVLERLESLENT